MDPAPRPWGLRGDPILFDAFKEAVADQPLPQSVDDLRTAYLTAFETLTGVALMEAPEHIDVQSTKRENGGMSNGFVCRAYWRDQLLPELIQRFEGTSR